MEFSDIKRRNRNEYSLYFCANLKALPVFKNIHIYIYYMVEKSLYSYSE